ncbi:MAG TPA: LCP family protein [Anaerolineales bacterium]|nr:LCP family protein [Anaerolineales bacterium]
MRKTTILTITVVLAAAVSGCGIGFLGGAPPGVLVTQNPLATITPTPFLPLPPTETPLPAPLSSATPTPLPTSVNPWGDFPGPAEPSAIEIPRPAPEIPFGPDVVNILLLGSDQRPYEGGHRTDTIIVLSLDLEAQTVTMLSIPRDLYVYVPGWRIDRINVADVRGGPQMIKQTILYNFGIPIHRWARINFYGFVTAVDLLGGIDVQITGYLSDNCMHTPLYYTPGTTRHMDGTTALCYVRQRETTGDLDRMRRAQELMRALFDRVVSLDGLSRVPDLYSQFGNLVETDLAVGDILPLVPLATTVSGDSAAIRQYAITGDMVTLWRVPSSGASVLLFVQDAVRALLDTAFPY